MICFAPYGIGMYDSNSRYGNTNNTNTLDENPQPTNMLPNIFATMTKSGFPSARAIMRLAL